MRNDEQLNAFLSFIIFLLGLSTVFTFMFPSIVITLPSEEKVKVLGFAMSLGVNVGFADSTKLNYHFNFLALLPYLLVIISTVISILLYFKPRNFLRPINLMCFFVSLVLFCVSVPLFKHSNAGEVYLEGAKMRLAIGTILAIIFTSIGTLSSLHMTLTTYFGDKKPRPMRKFQ